MWFNVVKWYRANLISLKAKEKWSSGHVVGSTHRKRKWKQEVKALTHAGPVTAMAMGLEFVREIWEQVVAYFFQKSETVNLPCLSKSKPLPGFLFQRSTRAVEHGAFSVRFSKSCSSYSSSSLPPTTLPNSSLPAHQNTAHVGILNYGR